MLGWESAHRRVLVAYGTRPEAIKLAPVVRSLRGSERLRPVVVVSGQHREMLDQVNELFGIVPDADLNVFAPGQSLTAITTRVLTGYTEFLAAHPVDAVVVQGDTTTAFAAALAGFYARVPVVHVEAGLRTGDRYAPFPEEVNRRLTAQTASLHLAPTSLARANLLAEGVAAGDVVVTGNTVIDALLHAVAARRPSGDPVVDAACHSGRPIVLVTAHRRESWGSAMAAIGRAVAGVAAARPDVLLVLPAHRNPVVREQLLPEVEGHDNVRVIEPLPYGPFCHLLSRSALVLTDSGGIQEEAPGLGVPVLVLRDTTERPEAVRAGGARLVGTDTGRIERAALDLLRDERLHRAMARAGSPFGDGRAARRSRAAIECLLGVGDREPEFETPGAVATRQP